MVIRSIAIQPGGGIMRHLEFNNSAHIAELFRLFCNFGQSEMLSAASRGSIIKDVNENFPHFAHLSTQLYNLCSANSLHRCETKM